MSVKDPRARLVAEAYDALGERFEEWRDGVSDASRARWLRELTSRLDEGATILELGCEVPEPDDHLGFHWMLVQR